MGKREGVTPVVPEKSFEFMTGMAAMAFVCIVAFWLIAALRFMVLAVVWFLAGSYVDGKKNQKPGLKRNVVIVLVLVTVLSQLTPPLFIRSKSQFKYRFQKWYVGLYQNIKEPDFMPDFAEDTKREYCFDYLPSIMQGTGHYSVRFQTTPEIAERYAEQFKKQAKCVLSYDTHPTGTATDFPAGILPKKVTTLSWFYDKNFWELPAENGKTPQIYVLEASGNENHPHSSVVIIDEGSGRIEFARLG